MEVLLPLAEMTAAEKIAAMEVLWESLSREPSDVPSPAWHGEILAAREERLNQGDGAFREWEESKKALRESRP